MQRYELEAWLGDDHGLDDLGLANLLTVANEIEDRYPDPDDHAERDAALTAAYRLITEPAQVVVSNYSEQRASALAAASAATAALQQAARNPVVFDRLSEAGFARAAGVDRMTVRKWRDKR
ncbi:hypothetical protein AB5J49_07795 [Streptomyces sp. R28]|uniref:Uncharacterized protein n=1 Tax=Streptomyces sp. R28 TaxID=3238628 RepID=A0AB39PRV7_9ACTN